MRRNWLVKRLIEGFYLVVFVVLGSVHTASAQQPKKMPRIGILRVASPPDLYIDALRQALNDAGYTEGQNILLEYRWLKREEQFAEAAEDLVRLNVDSIVVTSTPGALAARRATQSIPIIVPVMGDPIGSGLVTSFAHPGGNLTGLSNLAPELWPKRLELFKEMVPKLSRVAMLWNTNNPAMATGAKGTREAANAMSITIQDRGARDPNELDSVFNALEKQRPDGVLVMIDAFTLRNSKKIIDSIANARLPAMYDEKSPIAAGGLVSYGPDFLDLFRRTATYVDKILKGAKPADLPVEQPIKFELVINLNAANQIGLTVPPNILARADKVIR
jgi:putative tryptophan/tyrosine transport system substrate-binding protein